VALSEPIGANLRQGFEYSTSVFQVCCIDALGEPSINSGEQLPAFTLVSLLSLEST
jgi:hypothetical protein